MEIIEREAAFDVLGIFRLKLKCSEPDMTYLYPWLAVVQSKSKNRIS